MEAYIQFIIFLIFVIISIHMLFYNKLDNDKTENFYETYDENNYYNDRIKDVHQVINQEIYYSSTIDDSYDPENDPNQDLHQDLHQDINQERQYGIINNMHNDYPYHDVQNVNDQINQRNYMGKNHTHVLSKKLMDYYKPTVNSVYSPISLLFCSFLLIAGSRNNTLRELMNIFDNDHEKEFEKYVLGCKKVINGIDINNYVIIPNKIKATAKYENKVNDYAKIQYVDSNIDKLVKMINNQVSKDTRGMLNNVVDEGMFPSQFRSIVLLNTIYLKASWKFKFDKNSTHKTTFYGSNGERQIMMMSSNFNNGKSYYYYEDTRYQVISLEFSDNRISVIFILPFGNNRLSDIDSSYISRVYNHKEKVDVQIPQIEITTKTNLKTFFMKNGAKSIFEKADISNMVEKSDFWYNVNDIIQHAKIKLDETGVEAVAATAVMIYANSYKSEEIPNKKFIADHPFYYYVMYDKNIVLFNGVFC